MLFLGMLAGDALLAAESLLAAAAAMGDPGPLMRSLMTFLRSAILSISTFIRSSESSPVEAGVKRNKQQCKIRNE